EQQYLADAGVQGALADRYTALRRLDDAVRCRQRQLELYPVQPVFRAMADLYLDHGDDELYHDTLTRSLAAPAFGLEHARAHTDLARYHVRRKEWDAARPHAERAEQSNASW